MPRQPASMHARLKCLVIAGSLAIADYAVSATDSPAKPRTNAISVAALPAAFFSDKVFPLLEAKCFGCHGEPKDREAEFDMRTRNGLLKGGESGQPALVPHEPEKSRMLHAVLRQGELKMPPKDRNRLTTDEIEI